MYNHDFKTGDLVLIKNSRQDGPLCDKMQSQYMGPYMVVKQRSRGTYIVVELDGSIFRHMIAKFRVIPYLARKDMLSTVETVL
ncbi:hypothetical protein DACRYDRAFT_54520 [Dacryopinax primogenitus]|uniref:Integrase zinc-binding domain-containing protein n=1 Tax=Dacryopinax primogenitus (strain DJM 731) TaxID=1858805 RepID=M5FVG0_DACPD|nr:uncharacterized protein DACRYDRAFT_54520 [Dacryopinax primogenitus]EJU00274.1 hypothetical protein DACRYDRAFT_54520 [Dacryopinax primogenitus]